MSSPRVLLDGIALGESPRWHDGRLWFADWGAHEVVAVDLEGRREVICRVEDLPFSIDWLPDGRLTVVSGRAAKLLVQESDGTLATLADLSGIDPHPWNELVVDARGTAWVNTIGFDFPDGAVAPGLVARVRPDGSVAAVADNVMFPNGMAITPDGSTLIVGESYAHRLTAFEITPDGDLTDRRTWADLEGGYPDGICLDADGAVWYADVPGRRCVRVREGGEVLQSVEIDRGAFACTLGGQDGRTLFVMANAWTGPGGMMSDARTGQVLMVDAPAARAGRP